MVVDLRPGQAGPVMMGADGSKWGPCNDMPTFGGTCRLYRYHVSHLISLFKLLFCCQF